VFRYAHFTVILIETKQNKASKMGKFAVPKRNERNKARTPQDRKQNKQNI
jgi:hypothetical protein